MTGTSTVTNPLGLSLRDRGEAYYRVNRPLLFLGCPYSDPSIVIREERCAAASRVAARLMDMGYAVYSPISHGHAIANYGMGVGMEYETWMVVNDNVLSLCDAVVVLDIEGIRSSRGVAHEVTLATRLFVPINVIAESDKGVKLVLSDIDGSVWPLEVRS